MMYKMPTFGENEVFVIRTDGREESYTINPDEAKMTTVRRALGFDSFDFVHFSSPRGLPHCISMIVDDNGYKSELVQNGPSSFELKVKEARKPVNEKATQLYHSICKPGTIHQIVGDVALIHDSTL